MSLPVFKPSVGGSVCVLSSTGELVGLTILESLDCCCSNPSHTTATAGGALAPGAFACGGCMPQIGSGAPVVMLLLGTTGVSAIRLRPQDPPAQQAGVPVAAMQATPPAAGGDAEPAAAAAAAAAADESEEMKALRLRALEMLSADGEWE